jgi:hypothetical protein
MEKTIKKKTMIFSIGIAVIFLAVSLTSVVGFQAVSSSQKNSNSPLFHLRLEKITNQKENPSLSSNYVGKGSLVEIPLPTREAITEEMLNQLSTEAVKEKVRDLNSDLVEKWDSILAVARYNLPELNSIIRQDYSEFQALVTKYYAVTTQDATGQFQALIRGVNVKELTEVNSNPVPYEPRGNITSGPICNITSGQICQITTQPICKITTQPICSITKGFICWTVFGPVCPTEGIKCNPPTAHPKLCDFFANAGKILKTILILVILAVVIFIPFAVITMALITAVNPDRCTQIHERITTWFNCTASGTQ